MTSAIPAIGEVVVHHHAIGKLIRRMWPQVEADRCQIDGNQALVIRRIRRPRSAASAYPQLRRRIEIAVRAPHVSSIRPGRLERKTVLSVKCR